MHSLLLLLALLTKFSPHPPALHVSDERTYCAACTLVPIHYHLRRQLFECLRLRCEVKKSFGNAVGIARLRRSVGLFVVLVLVRFVGAWAQSRPLLEYHGALQLAVYSVFATF